jgi:hypothetical protein
VRVGIIKLLKIEELKCFSARRMAHAGAIGMLLCNATGAATAIADDPRFRARQYIHFGRPRFSSLPISALRDVGSSEAAI